MFPEIEIPTFGSHVLISTQLALILICISLAWIYFAFRYRSYPGVLKITLMTGLITMSSFIGGRLFHVLFERPQFYLTNPHLIFSNLKGLTFYGGIATGGLTYYLLSQNWIQKDSVRPRFLDDSALLTTLLIVVLRVGCFAEGCCWGRLSALPWAVQYSHPHSAMPALGLPVHPVQIYDGLIAMSIFALLLRLRTNRAYQGHLFAVLGTLYPIGRFWTEIYRGDAYRGENILFGLSTSQLISILIVPFGLFALRRRIHLFPYMKRAGLAFFALMTLSGCSLPRPPGPGLVSQTHVYEHWEIHDMRPVPNGLRSKNAIFAAVDNSVQKDFVEPLAEVYQQTPPPRLEDIGWWAMAPTFQRIYKKVLRIPHDKVSKNSLFEALEYMESMGQPYDLYLMTHGIPNHLIFSKGTPVLSYKDVAEIQGRLGNLDLLFLQACFGSTLAPDFHRAGARYILSFEGLNRNFFFVDFFARRYSKNPRNIESAYRKTVSTIARKMANSLVYQKIFEAFGTSAETYLAESPPPQLTHLSVSDSSSGRRQLRYSDP